MYTITHRKIADNLQIKVFINNKNLNTTIIITIEGNNMEIILVLMVSSPGRQIGKKVSAGPKRHFIIDELKNQAITTLIKHLLLIFFFFYLFLYVFNALT